MSKISMDPADVSILKEAPLDALRSFITPNRDHYVVAALGIPRPVGEWFVTVGGAVMHPLEMSLEAIRELPDLALTITMECAGDPLAPDRPVRRVSTARWRGVPLDKILERARPHPGSSHVWIDGADWGVYRPGSPTAERVSEYRKDVPLARVLQGDVLLAYEMNGEPLPPEHGYPIRVIIPGYYGTNSVKWVNNLVVANGRPSTLFSSVLYNTAVDVDGAIERRQVAEIQVNSLLTSHRTGDVVPRGIHRFTGWAWGAEEIVRMQLHIDRDGQWLDAHIGARRDGAWQPFEVAWTVSKTGRHVISMRATDSRGNTQPVDEHINQVASIEIEVV